MQRDNNQAAPPETAALSVGGSIKHCPSTLRLGNSEIRIIELFTRENRIARAVLRQLSIRRCPKCESRTFPVVTRYQKLILSGAQTHPAQSLCLEAAAWEIICQANKEPQQHQHQSSAATKPQSHVRR